VWLNCCRDVATLAMIEQHRKHKTEVMAVSVSALDANFVVAGDRQGRITAWERDAYVGVHLCGIGRAGRC
jgi:hypothetical protein